MAQDTATITVDECTAAVTVDALSATVTDIPIQTKQLEQDDVWLVQDGFELKQK